MTRVIDMDFAVVEQRSLAGFSLLADCQPPRDLETALAEYTAKAKTGSPEMETANRLFQYLVPAAQHRVRVKIDGLRRTP